MMGKLRRFLLIRKLDPHIRYYFYFSSDVQFIDIFSTRAFVSLKIKLMNSRTKTDCFV